MQILPHRNELNEKKEKKRLWTRKRSKWSITNALICCFSFVRCFFYLCCWFFFLCSSLHSVAKRSNRSFVVSSSSSSSSASDICNCHFNSKQKQRIDSYVHVAVVCVHLPWFYFISFERRNTSSAPHSLPMFIYK